MHDPSTMSLLEDLIVRQLDGELTHAEVAQLEALLADNPNGHALRSQYQVVDELAARALKQAVVPTRREPEHGVMMWSLPRIALTAVLVGVLGWVGLSLFNAHPSHIGEPHLVTNPQQSMPADGEPIETLPTIRSGDEVEFDGERVLVAQVLYQF